MSIKTFEEHDRLLHDPLSLLWRQRFETPHPARRSTPAFHDSPEAS
jgi:hypothetical protein